MQTYSTPGVQIEHVLTEPERVLRTGVPVFLGLVCRQDLVAYNAQQSKLAKQFLVQDCPVFITRKRAYQKLPSRSYAPEGRGGFVAPTFYLTTPGDRPAGGNLEQVRALGGAGGQTSGVAESPAQAISDKPQRFTLWAQFVATYGDLQPYGFLCDAVRGFFENGGDLCYVQMIGYDGDSPVEAVRLGLQTLEAYDDFDLVCVPDILWPPSASVDSSLVCEMQAAVLRHCDTLGDRFALLDALPGDAAEQVLSQRRALSGDNGALYYPWVGVRKGSAATAEFVPPCGHVAGVIARTDLRVGVHKAPANEDLEGVVDLAAKLTNEQQGPLNEESINCLRAFPRRGIRVWGARTLSQIDAWRYINVRRIFLTAGRWIERNMTDVVFEPNTPALWGRIVRDLTIYFTQLLERGALAGRGAGEAFYVKCDAETNPRDLQETGVVATEIGLAPAVPAEFIVVRIIHGPAGVNIIGPA